MTGTPRNSLLMSVAASLFAALITVGAYVAIPVGPVPIVLQNLFVFLVALLLPPRWAASSVGVYLLAGALGLPVFAGGGAGLGHFAGPTGGYLVAYLPASAVIAFIARAGAGRAATDAAAVVVGGLCVYAVGVPWLKAVLGLDWSAALTAGMLPFLVGDAVKAAAAVGAARLIRPLWHEFLQEAEER